MRLREPEFWKSTSTGSWQATALKPASWIWGRIAGRRLRREAPFRSSLPVIAIGNFTAGGTGKTPFAIEVARLLSEAGEVPAFLTRGYGGRAAGPTWVDAGTARARDVGDEPLLLARRHPTMVAKDRAAGARAIAEEGKATVIVMDDGVQSNAIARALTLMLVDGVRGLGNGRVLPSGPLRAPIDAQLAVTDAIIVMTPPDSVTHRVASAETLLGRAYHGPIFSGAVAADERQAMLAGRVVVAYAGIGAPERFFALLQSLGAKTVVSRAFGDHEAISESDAADLLALARSHEAMLVTTEKDLARLTGETGARAELAEASMTLPVRTVLTDDDRRRLSALLELACRRSPLPFSA